MPKLSRSRALVLLPPLVLLVGAAPAAFAQNHKHYEDAPEAAQPGPAGQLAPRLQNLGPHTFKTTTRSAKAQLFINQGVNLAYGFNHAEAARAFREAARLDPECAMAYWGEALVLGPNINAAMNPEDEPKAYEAIQKAGKLKARATARERDLIDALAQRYTGKAEDRAAGDKAYSAAMHALSKKYSGDLDIAALYAESVMDLRPWGYWMRDGTPHEGTAEIVALMEAAIQKNPKHPLALHLYIHLMEPTQDAAKAEKAADLLLPLMPGAGHMVHMPSHIYQRVGRYADAAKSNDLAARADEDYITQCNAQGLYPMGYYPHNVHFLWFAASMDGRSQLAIEQARKVASKVPDDAMKELPFLAGFRVVPYYALTRFGRWDEMLKEPAPPDNLYLTGSWHYARGLSFLAKGQLFDAEKELVEVRRVADDKALEFPLFSPNNAAQIFAVAPAVLAGELHAARNEYDAALADLERAVRLEDSLVYTEPSEWHYPPRHALGAVLLEAGRAREAETVYWEDLKRNPENGWALFGLAQALQAQGKNPQADLIRKRLEKAWARADVKPSASRMLR